jgi:hypothetical protein
MPLLTSIMAASRRRVDPDAADYFARIVAAGSTISEPNKAAVNALVAGCKADGIWNAIKASCLLAGPDDLTGALVPLVGAAPTNFNFVAGDYNRVTGLKGNGGGNYLDAGISAAAIGQDNLSLAVFFSVVDTNSVVDGIAGNYVGNSANNWAFLQKQTNMTALGAANSNFANFGVTLAAGLFGVSRAAAGNYTRRVAGTTAAIAAASASPSSAPILVFRRGDGVGSLQRSSFYHIGEALDLALLDARLATYMSSLT